MMWGSLFRGELTFVDIGQAVISFPLAAIVKEICRFRQFDVD
jgi:hypothetical protein